VTTDSGVNSDKRFDADPDTEGESYFNIQANGDINSEDKEYVGCTWIAFLYYFS
jgi:hypothetical protein